LQIERQIERQSAGRQIAGILAPQRQNALALGVLTRLLLHAHFGAFGTRGENILHLAPIQARRETDLLVARAAAGAQVAGQCFGEASNEFNAHQGFELRAVDANADTNIDDRIERGRQNLGALKAIFRLGQAMAPHARLRAFCVANGSARLPG
jgi:hypothetical protein